MIRSMRRSNRWENKTIQDRFHSKYEIQDDGCWRWLCTVEEAALRGHTYSDIAKYYKMNPSVIGKAATKQTWRHI